MIRAFTGRLIESKKFKTPFLSAARIHKNFLQLVWVPKAPIDAISRLLLETHSDEIGRALMAAYIVRAVKAKEARGADLLLADVFSRDRE